MRNPKKLLFKKPKKKKSLFANKFFWLFILLIVLTGTASYFLLFHPFFKIKNISLNNQSNISADLLKNSIYQHLNNDHWFFIPKNSILLVSQEAITADLAKQYPELKNITLKKNFYPLSLTLTTEMRKPIATWCFSDGVTCFLIDTDGVIFQTTKKEDNASLNLPLILAKTTAENQLGQRIYSPQSLQKINLINQICKDPITISLKNFLVDETSFITAVTQEGWEVYFDLDGDIDTALLKLKALLKQELPKAKRNGLQYIDLRFSKVYYK